MPNYYSPNGNLEVWNEKPNGYYDMDEWYKLHPNAITLDELKAQKIDAFKFIRDFEEVKPIQYGDNLFDYDDKARDRINSAIIALDMMGDNTTIEWTTADNTNVTVTADDLRGVVANVAVRSNELHVKYRNAKAKIEEAQTAEELEAIEL